MRRVTLSLLLFLVIFCIGCTKEANQPTGGGPGTTPAVFYAGKLYVERYVNDKAELIRLQYKEVGTIVKTVTEDWPSEDFFASAIESGTTVYSGYDPATEKTDDYLYVMSGDTYIRLAAE